MASALTISAPSREATSRARAVLPAAVGPTSASTGPGRSSPDASPPPPRVAEGRRLGARRRGGPPRWAGGSCGGQHPDQVADAVGRVVVEEPAADLRGALERAC